MPFCFRARVLNHFFFVNGIVFLEGIPMLSMKVQYSPPLEISTFILKKLKKTDLFCQTRLGLVYSPEAMN